MYNAIITLTSTISSISLIKNLTVFDLVTINFIVTLACNVGYSYFNSLYTQTDQVLFNWV